MSLLGTLLRSAWKSRPSAGQPTDPGRKIVELATAGRTEEALALASGCSDLDWGRLAEALPAAVPDAERIHDLCLTHAADRSPVLLALARWLSVNGQPVRAYQCAQEAQRLKPAEPFPLVTMGWLQLGLGNPRGAGRHFLAAIRRDEHHKEALRGYRMAWQQAPEVLPPITAAADEKEACLRTAIQTAPDDYKSYLALGKHLAASSRCTLALPYLRTAHELAPQEAEPAYWLAWSQASLGDYQSALAVALEAQADAPEHIGLLKLAAECASHLGQEAQALEWFKQLVESGFADHSVFANHGDCLNQLERFEEGAEALRQALVLNPSQLETRRNLAYSYHCLGHYAEALEQLDTLLQSEKNDFSARWYRATCLLAAHRFSEGWRDYEFRFASTAVEGRIIPLPAWRGEALEGKKIVVVAEQGIGDEIMFASCLPELIADAGHCVVECNVRLVELFRRSFPEATIVEWRSAATPPWLVAHGDADYHVFCGSLPLRFRQALPDFDRYQPYLVTDQRRIGWFRQRLAELGGKLKVGIAWQGGGNTSRTKTRSLRLEQLQPLFDVPDCSFVSIQYGNRSEEVAAFNLKSGATLHHWPEAIADLDAFAAFVSSLDIIVTVCSAPVHFAGALGKPALVLTPHAPEWRYRGIEGRMLWYPSVRLFPQERLNDWTGAIRSVADILRQKACADAAAD